MDNKRYAFATEVTGKEIKMFRAKFSLTQARFAHLINVSVKTVERWESSDKPITGPIVPLLRIMLEHPQLEVEFQIPEKQYPLRLWYMHDNQICSVIDVDTRMRRVQVMNYTKDNISKAFGVNEKPTYEEYEAFLESRCFPRTRDKMKLELERLGIPYYDPYMIIEKTQGRMAEDNYWIRIER
nr:transcriptional regulator [Eubacterium sp.]